MCVIELAACVGSGWVGGWVGRSVVAACVGGSVGRSGIYNCPAVSKLDE